MRYNNPNTRRQYETELAALVASAGVSPQLRDLLGRAVLGGPGSGQQHRPQPAVPGLQFPALVRLIAEAIPLHIESIQEQSEPLPTPAVVASMKLRVALT